MIRGDDGLLYVAFPGSPENPPTMRLFGYPLEKPDIGSIVELFRTLLSFHLGAVEPKE